MEHTPFIPLLLITGLAMLVPLLARSFRRVRIPIVVGEIVAGMAIGQSGFDLVQSSPTLEFLAEFGFAMLMFLSGLEVDFSLLLGTAGSKHKNGRWTQPLPLAVIALALTLGLASAGAFGLRELGLVEKPLLVGLLLSTTSLGVVLPVLKERRAHTTRFGQYLLVAASVADFVTLVLLTVVIAASTGGLGPDLLLVLVLLTVFALLARFAPRFAAIPTLRKFVEELAHATAQIRVRGAFALMVALVVLAQALGVEVILGAFLAGAVVGLLAGRQESILREKLDAIGFGFFIPIFFIMVGVHFDLPELLTSRASIMLVPLLVALAYIVKLVPALIFRAQFSWREAFAAGSLLSARLSLIIAVSAIALKIGAISVAMNAAIVLVAVVTCTLSPMLFNVLQPRISKPARKLAIIAGRSQLATMLAKRLRFHGRDVVLVHDDAESLSPNGNGSGRLEWAGDDMENGDINVVEGPAEDLETWQRAGADKAEAFVAVRSDPDVTLHICELARSHFNIPVVVARIQPTRVGDHNKLGHVEAIRQLQAMGVKVVQPAIAMSVALEAALCYPSAFEVMVDHDDNVEMGEAVINNGEMHGRTVREIQLPGNALIVSIHRGDGTVLVPHGDTTLSTGDHVALIGDLDSLGQAIEILGDTG